MICLSCSSNDSSNSNAIIGTWKTVKEAVACSTGIQQTEALDSCVKSGRSSFFENGTAVITEFNLVNGHCEQVQNITATWSLNGNNLTLAAEGQIINTTFFKLTSNILRIGYYNVDPNEFCDGGNITSHYYTEFARIEE